MIVFRTARNINRLELRIIYVESGFMGGIKLYK